MFSIFFCLFCFVFVFFFFFFSSRRRHTRLTCDWSSDVCSSDLNAWANRRCFAALEPLPAESYFRDLKSSHGGLHGTMCHIVWAEHLWLKIGRASCRERV